MSNNDNAVSEMFSGVLELAAIGEVKKQQRKVLDNATPENIVQVDYANLKFNEIKTALITLIQEFSP